MAKRQTVEEQWHEARTLARLPLDDALRARIRDAVAHRSNLVAAAGAQAAKAHRLEELIPALVAAYGRFCEDPVRSDKVCQAKLAITDALDELGHDDEAIYRHGVTHRQFEPAFGGPSDTAGPLRIRAAQALVAHHCLDASRLLTDLLADAQPRVRSAAAQLIGQLGGERAELVLRLRIHLRDTAPENLADYCSALVTADAGRAVPFLTPLLDDGDDALAEAAALALGESRRAEAFAPLAEAFREAYDDDRRRFLVTSIALLRSDDALAFLLRQVAGDDCALAKEARAGLRLYADRPEVAAFLASA